MHQEAMIPEAIADARIIRASDMTELVKPRSISDGIITRAGGLTEEMQAKGQYFVQIFDGKGNLKSQDTIQNVVCSVGKILALDTFLAAASYAVVGPFMGLISSVTYTGVPLTADTMGTHGTWYEVSATTYFPTVAARLTTNGGWSAATGTGSKSLATALSFTIITNAGTLKGCFLVFGSGAVATLGSAAGTLYSAGVFTGGDKVVQVSDVVQVSYTASM